jgi:hypothetical protein
MTPQPQERRVVTLSEFQQYCSDKHSGSTSLPALFEFMGGREKAIQAYMESGFDTPMMEWLAGAGMSEIVFRRMQIESNRQVIASLRDIRNSIEDLVSLLTKTKD